MDNTKCWIFDVPIQEDNINSKRVKELLSRINVDADIKINLSTKDKSKRTYWTRKNVGVYIVNDVLYFRFTSALKLNTEKVKIEVVDYNANNEIELLTIDLYTEDPIFAYTNILCKERYMKIKYNYYSYHSVGPIEKDGDDIDQYNIDNDDIYKSKKIYEYILPISNPQIGGGFEVPRKALQAIIKKRKNITKINIKLDETLRAISKYVKPCPLSYINQIYYCVFYSNKKLKNPENIKLTNASSVDQFMFFDVENLSEYDEIFFWDKSFENKKIETVYSAINEDLKKAKITVPDLDMVTNNTSIDMRTIKSLIKESNVVFLKYSDCSYENFIELKLGENLVIENDKIKIKTSKEYKGYLYISNYKFNKNGFKTLFIESDYINEEDEDILSVIRLRDSQYDFVKIHNVSKEVLDLYFGAKNIDINLHTSDSGLYEYKDYNAIYRFLSNLYLVYKKDPDQNQKPMINFINYDYDENGILTLRLYLKSKLFSKNILNIFTDTALYSSFLEAKKESYIKLPLDKECKDKILNKIINNEKVEIEIYFLKSSISCISYLILNKVAFVSNNEIYIKILSKRDNIVGNQIELKYLPYNSKIGNDNTVIRFNSNAITWSKFRIESITDDIKELQLFNQNTVFNEEYNLMLNKISSGYKYKIRFLSQNNNEYTEEYIINNRNCRIKNNILNVDLICTPKDPNELLNPIIKNIDNDNYIIEVESLLNSFLYIFTLGTGYSNKNKEISIDIDKKNNKVISWDEYFMGVAELSARRSKDPNRQVGACITKNNVIVGTGYNGFPRGCSDKEFPWTKDSDEITETKYAYVVHAELNAILNSTRRNLNDAVLYVTLFPCNECTKAIIQSGIKKVIYKEAGKNQKEIDASLKMFKASEVEVIKYK